MNPSPFETFVRVCLALFVSAHLFGATPPRDPPVADPFTANNTDVKAAAARARAVTLAAIGGGLAIAGLFIWLLWRRREEAALRKVRFAERISDAASGLPSESEIASWSKKRLCATVAGLAESDGYTVSVGVPPFDFVLSRPREEMPSVMVTCVGEKEMDLETLTRLTRDVAIAGGRCGWIVYTAGIAKDARAFASGRKEIELLDPTRLLSMLRQVPPLLLPEVLGYEFK